MFKFKSLLLLGTLLSVSACDNPIYDDLKEAWDDAGEPRVCDSDSTAVSFKRIGYWRADDTTENYLSLDYDNYTHLVYGPIVIDSEGNLAEIEDDDMFEEIAKQANNKNVKLMLSLSATAATFTSIVNTESVQKNFLASLTKFIDDYNDDGQLINGVSIDWRFPLGDTQKKLHNDLIELVNEELVDIEKDIARNMLLSFVVPSGSNSDYAKSIDEDAIDLADFVHIYAFDPGTITVSGQDGDLQITEQDSIDANVYWKTERCVITNKRVLTIPFYSSGGDAIRSYSYIVDDDKNHPTYACADRSERRDYNGVTTVIAKTNYAKSNMGGVDMLWASHDTFDSQFSDYALRRVINETIQGSDLSSLCP